jgi:enoyl-CoA hydratase/carnithine racemase
MRLTMTAEVISAQTALDYGLITQMAEKPLDEAMHLASQVAERSPDAVAALKKLYHQNWFKAEWKMLAKESYYQLKILLGKNQSKAVKRQLNTDKNIKYVVRNKW